MFQLEVGKKYIKLTLELFSSGFSYVPRFLLDIHSKGKPGLTGGSYETPQCGCK